MKNWMKIGVDGIYHRIEFACGKWTLFNSYVYSMRRIGDYNITWGLNHTEWNETLV